MFNKILGIIYYGLTTLAFWFGIFMLQDRCSGTSSLITLQKYYCHYRSMEYWQTTFLLDSGIIFGLMLLRFGIQQPRKRKVILYITLVYLSVGRLLWYVLIQILERPYLP